jgi:hypothetical protein
MPDALVDQVDVASRALTNLQEADLDGLSADQLSELVLALQQVRGRLEAAEARVLARWDAERAWQPSGAKTAAAWLAWKQRVPIAVARQRVRHARAMRSYPEIEQAWRTGEIDRTHVVTLLSKRNPRTAEAFDRDHGALVEAACTRGFVDFKRLCDRWELFADPDGAERSADDDRAAREVHLSESFGGMWFGTMTLDPISGTIVDETLAAIDRELFEADWAEAKGRLGRAPLITELVRTPAQRRADALVEMAIRARTAPADGRRPAPLFTVVVDVATLSGPVLELFNRRTITPGTAAAWLTEADVERIVFDGGSRVLDVGRRRRFFRGALRRALEVRDRTCFHPSCDEVPQCQHIDHVQPYSAGGETTQENGRPGCSFHNERRNHHPDPDDDPDPP